MTWPANRDPAAEPRASRIPLPHRPDLVTEIWMGGSDSLLGEPIALDQLPGAVVVDCAGDLATPFRERAGRYLPRVFMDAELAPFAFPRITALVHDLAEAIAPAGGGVTGPAPARVYILCQYGMNRSGLVTALLLRALGEEADDAVRRIRRLRPGALSNETFTRLIADWVCPHAG